MDKNSNVLTEADKYYIENNRSEKIDVLMKALGKSKELIKNYILLLEQKEHVKKNKKGESPLLKQIYRKSGATALTAEATSMSEELAKSNPPGSQKGKYGKDILTVRDN